MSIKLKNILCIAEDEYDQWTFCLNEGIKGKPNSFFCVNKEDREALMRHISYKTGASRKRSFRKIDTKYCFQFVCLVNESRYDNWLFLGAFENRGIKTIGEHKYYDLTPIDRFKEYAERLIIKYKKHPGDTQAKLKIRTIETIEVLEILPQKYINRNRPFPGYKDLSVSFSSLSEIINNRVANWYEHLSTVQCIYAITDKYAKKIYIGSTYGFGGIWQRWTCYVNTRGHGGDVELKKLIEENPNYAYNNFYFAILEYFYDVDKDTILDRENKWKELLQTRSLGYNAN